MRKTSQKTWIWLVVLLLIFVSISVVFGANKPKDYPPFLSTSPSPSGVKGFYTYLEEETYSVRRWEHAPSLLKKTGNQLLLMVEPSLITEQKVMDDYLEYIEAGNTVLIFKRNLEGMFGISTDVGMTGSETVTIEGLHGASLDASMFSQVRILPEAGDQVLLQDDLGAIAIKRTVGNGSLIAVNSPDWLTNQYILEEDNLMLVLGLLEEENWNSILIDEFSHQRTAEKSLTTVYPMWMLVAGLQLILFTLLWLLYKGKRYGPVRIPREDYVRFSDERITALASWYQKGRAYQDSLVNQAEYVRLILREKWGIPSQKDWKDLKAPLALKLTTMTEKEINTVINDIETALHKPNITKQEYLLWSKRLDRLQKEVEET